MIGLQKTQTQLQEIPMTTKAATQLNERIKSTELKLQQLKSQQELKFNREREAHKKRERSAETRRKVILGALVFKAFTREINPWPINELAKLLNEELTRIDDRALFADLIPLEKDNQK